MEDSRPELPSGSAGGSERLKVRFRSTTTTTKRLWIQHTLDRECTEGNNMTDRTRPCSIEFDPVKDRERERRIGTYLVAY